MSQMLAASLTGALYSQLSHSRLALTKTTSIDMTYRIGRCSIVCNKLDQFAVVQSHALSVRIEIFTTD